ncbi:MAG TPA: RidA family protein [Burkholderiaceae bacterium]
MTSPPSGIAQPLARYSAYRRVGDFVFLSGVIAVDPAAAKIVKGYADIPNDAAELIGRTGEFSSDFKEGPVLAQSWYVLDRIRQTVESAGGQMSDVFKLVQYFKDLDHFPLYSRVRKLFFPGEPPASTVVEVSAMLPSADILIEVEATAYLPLSPSR